MAKVRSSRLFSLPRNPREGDHGLKEGLIPRTKLQIPESLPRVLLIRHTPTTGTDLACVSGSLVLMKLFGLRITAKQRRSSTTACTASVYRAWAGWWVQ